MAQYAELCTLIDNELDHCLVLQQILLTERSLIETRQLDSLPKVLRQKADLLSAIENSHNQRINWLQDMNLPTAYAEFVEKCNNSDPAQETNETVSRNLCSSKWQELNAAKESCNDHNTVNGIIISKAKKRNSEQLEILKGITPGKKLYDAKGQTIVTGASNKSHIA